MPSRQVQRSPSRRTSPPAGVRTLVCVALLMALTAACSSATSGGPALLAGVDAGSGQFALALPHRDARFGAARADSAAAARSAAAQAAAAASAAARAERARLASLAALAAANHARAGAPTASAGSAPSFAFPVPVTVGSARQVITVAANGSYATVTAWQLADGRWVEELRTTAARVGANGVVPAAERHQGTNTTPGGTFTLTQAFGIDANPGTRMPYHLVQSDDWWVEDNNSAYYNQMRTSQQGGFDTSLPESNVNGSEHLITHTVTYQYAVVIDFNRWPAIRYKGAGIFLHVNGSGSTAGCVSVPLATMVALLRWLNPAMSPRIAIA
jgi:L,D-peptidoglycan transpeptidase YkuD (ErfK/YbiS/YcfS/YnhG family)